MCAFEKLSVALVVAWLVLSASPAADCGNIQTLSLCELRSNGGDLLNKTVRLRAVYIVGFEWQEFVSAHCTDGKPTWVEFSDDVEKCSSQQARTWLRSCDGDETVGLVMRGRLTARDGHFGHSNGYDSVFTIDCVESVTILSKAGSRSVSPQLLERIRRFEGPVASTTPNYRMQRSTRPESSSFSLDTSARAR